MIHIHANVSTRLDCDASLLHQQCTITYIQICVLIQSYLAQDSLEQVIDVKNKLPAGREKVYK